MPHTTIPLLDWLIIVCYLAGSTAIGLFASKAPKSAEGYLVGGRHLSWWMLLLSIVATETSTVTFLSLPAKSFLDGGNLTFLQLTFGYITGRLLLTWLVLPIFFSGSYLTAYEVLQNTFGKNVRSFVSLLFLVMRNSADGLRLLLTGLLIGEATGFDFNVCVLVLAVCTAIYAGVGGVASVVINDCLQFAMYMIGAAVVMTMLLTDAPGGSGEVWRFAGETGRLRLFDFDPSIFTSSITFWSGLIGGATLTMASHGADHMMVQRYLCARSQRQAGWAVGLSGPVVALQFTLFLMIGIGLAYWQSAGALGYDVTRGDQALIGFVVHKLGVGLRGLVIAAVLAASMSTLSSSLNASAGVLVSDLGKRFLPDMTDRGMLFGAKVATFVFAAVQAGVAIGAYYSLAPDSAVIDAVLGIAGFSTGIVLGVFLLGAVLGRASEAAGMIGITLGLACCCYAKFGINVSWPWFSLIGASVTFVVGYLVAQATPPEPEPS
ncbi:Sodium/glucose cotransporter [Posidoniimonas corsicana]|uniref:Sodium/glucose cotransporter n=1 Tax=Posidoniimonas corsicana TaxID=1938618 RepID=A0A5C5VFL4_9BACT|nr:transporter [Posidoniimonas corsicana]TWT37434.1 Sodium/glucose cotransporter [Posidoniimonas corsicana]